MITPYFFNKRFTYANGGDVTFYSGERQDCRTLVVTNVSVVDMDNQMATAQEIGIFSNGEKYVLQSNIGAVAAVKTYSFTGIVPLSQNQQIYFRGWSISGGDDIRMVINGFMIGEGDLP
jgi:hypothetical protein